MKALEFKKLLENHYIVYMTKYHPYYYRYVETLGSDVVEIEGGSIDNPKNIDEYSWIDKGVDVRNSKIKRSIITTPEQNESLLISITDSKLENCEINCSSHSHIYNVSLEGDFIEIAGKVVVLGDSSINGVFQYHNPPYSLTVKESSISRVTRMINVIRDILIINSNLSGSQNFTPEIGMINGDPVVIENKYIAEDGVISLNQLDKRKHASNK